MGEYKWLAYALSGAVLAAVSIVMTKRVLSSIDVAVAATVQSIMMLMTMLAVTTIGGRWAGLERAPKWAMALTLGSGVVAGLAWFFGYQALRLTEISRATTIDRLSLPIAVLLGVLLFRDRPSGLNWLGVACMVCGAILVSRPQDK
jgi:transporter family protein